MNQSVLQWRDVDIITHYSDITIWKLTHDGHDDDHKVEDVPVVAEVVFSERYDLQNELYEENDDEEEVEPVQDSFFLMALMIRLHHQKHHVQADQNHHEDFKIRFGDQVEDVGLALVLRTQRGRSDNADEMQKEFWLFWVYSEFILYLFWYYSELSLKSFQVDSEIFSEFILS